MVRIILFPHLIICSFALSLDFALPMASHLLLFIFLLSFHSPSAASSTPKTNSGPEINITKNLFFPDFGSINSRISPDITLLGSAAISDQNGGCIHIPGTDLPYAAGRAIHSSPIRMFDPATQAPASFRTTFSFLFLNPSNSTDSVYNSGGFSFIIAPDQFTLGRPGPWLGMLNDACDDDYKQVSVEFDTHMNPEYGDPNDNHVGINLASIVSTTAINVSAFGIRLNDGSVHRAWINYDGNKKFVDIFLGPDDNVLPEKPIYSGSLDLSTYLSEYMFVGFSASTGYNWTQVHGVCSWNFTSVSGASLRVPSAETCDSKIRVEKRRFHNVPFKTPNSFLIFMAVVALVLIVMISLYLNGKRKKKTSDETVVISDVMLRRPRPPTRGRKFNFAELSSLTRGFHESQVLGSDNRSVTYKGTFINGCNVAVKRYSDHFFGARASDRRRMNKLVKKMSKIRHPNLVPVKGWCFDSRVAAVVYDFIPNGSLDEWLLGFGVLPWTRRFKVVKSVGEALNHIHSKGFAHKNVKSSSVFLDVSFRAVLGDYGFVLSSTESTRFEASISQKVDVFEFGVLLLEVVSGRGRKPGEGEMDLLDLAWAMHETGEKEKVVDSRMGSTAALAQAIRVLEVGLMCTLNDNKGRPGMVEVVEYLNDEESVAELPSSRPVSLFPYSSTTGLCSGYSCAGVAFK